MKLLFLNGPNLNMLGIREPDIYGRQTYAALEDYIRGFCRELGIEGEIFQSNHEGRGPAGGGGPPVRREQAGGLPAGVLRPPGLLQNLRGVRL